MVGVIYPPLAISGLDVDALLDMGAYDLLADIIAEHTAGVGVTVDGLVIKDKKLYGCDCLAPQNKDKVASDNLRHSIDANDFYGYTTYTQIPARIFTFTNGIKGVIRVKGRHDAPAGLTTFSQLFKNGEGAALYTKESPSDAQETWSTDLTVDWAPGTTLNWFGKTSAAGNSGYSNFRIYYDDGIGFSAVAVGVTGAD